MELGRKRAESIRAYLIARGALTVADSQAISLGSSNPVIVSTQPQLNNEACQRDETHNFNRRVVLREQRAGAAAQVSFWYRPAAGGEFRPLTNGAILHTRDQIKVKMEPFETVHTYVFHHGSAGDWAMLFPNKDITPGAAANPLPGGASFWIPGKGDGLALDETTGAEETLVFVSPGPDPELELIAAQIRGGIQPTSAAPRPPRTAIQGGAVGVTPTPGPIPGGSLVTPQPPPRPEPIGDMNIITRGLKGVAASKPGNLLLKLRSFASVKFEHQPAQ